MNPISDISPHILLMEDEDSLGRGLQMILSEAGYSVDWTTSGRGALDRFHQKPADLLMADLRLPDIDGMEVIRQVKKQWPETVIVVITGYASVSSAVESMKMGVFDYLSKPFTEDEIKTVVDQALKKKPAPAHVESSGILAGKRESSPVGKTARLLLLEDDPSVSRGLEMVLTEAGYDVKLAETGKKAIDIVDNDGIDVLVADLRLPDIDGLGVIRKVKEGVPDTAVVVITGYPSVSTAVDAIKLGASDYLAKPFTEDEVTAAVEEALRIREQAHIRELMAGLDSDQGKLIQKREVVRVLDRAARDETFWKALLEQGSDALAGFALSAEAKAAIVSGDLKWLVDHVGTLTDAQRLWIESRLEMERW